MPIESISSHLDCRFIKFSPILDERGYFYESLNDQIFDIIGFYPKQENISKSRKSVVRGLHMQNKPPSSKLVRVIQGEINDVAVDYRIDSPTFGKHVMIRLSAEVPGWFFIPGGYAHGFETISDFAVVNYLVSEKYSPGSDLSFFAYDPDLKISWETPEDQAIMSSKDKSAKKMSNYIK